MSKQSLWVPRNTSRSSLLSIIDNEVNIIVNDTGFVTLAGTQSITGVKTFTAAPIISTITNTGTLSLPSITTTLVGRSTTDTLSNKTLLDTTTTFANTSDPTKHIKLDLSTVATTKTLTLQAPITLDRTITFPDKSTAIVGTNTSDTLQNKVFGDGTTISKTAKFDLSGSAASTLLTLSSTNTVSRTISFPDLDGIFALTSQIPSNSTYVDLTSAQNISGIKTITNSTQSTSDTTGCLILQGGLGCQKDSYFTGVFNAGSTANFSGTSTFYSSLVANSTGLFNSDLIVSSAGALKVNSAAHTASTTFAGGSDVSLALPVSSGTIALTSQIPSNSTYVDLTTAQSISGQKTMQAQLLTNLGIRQVAGTYNMGSSVISNGLSLNSPASTFNDDYDVKTGTNAQMNDLGLYTKTLTASNLSVTITNAASLYIQSAPAASTNITITNPYALQIDSGNAFLKAGSLLFGNSGFTNTLSTASLGANKVLTLPAISDTLITKTSTDVLTNKSLSDTTSIFVNASDNTKVAKFDLSGATASKTLTLAAPVTNNRTITYFDASDTLVGKATTDVLTNKDLTSATNSFPRSFNKLTTTYRFYNNASLTSGATNNVVLQGNGTPAIPISASAVLVTIFGTYSADNAYIEACPGGGLSTATSSHTLYGQREGGTGSFAHTALIILNPSDGSIDIRVNGGNATSVDSSVLAWIY